MTALLAFLCLSAPAAANDTFASINGGNVTFEKTDDVSMDSEELSVSQDEVRVDYVFRNHADRPLATTVSFPLAPLFSETPASVDPRDWLAGKDPIHFELTENGQRKPVEIAVRKEVLDKTDDVYKLHVAYFWKAVFPGGKTVRIAHRYRSILGTGGLARLNDFDIRRYCIDRAFLDAFEALKKRLVAKLEPAEASHLDQYMHFHSYGRFSYVLKTANNWAGPIGRFRLKLRKRAPSTLVSLCWKGSVRKVSPTEFEAEATDFRPGADLEILFVDDR